MNRIEFSRRWRRVTAVIAGGLPACGCLLLGSGVLLNKTFDWAGLLAAVGMFAFVAMIPASFLNSTDTDRLWAWKEAWRAWLFGSDPHGMGSSAARRVWRALWPMATAAGLVTGLILGGLSLLSALLSTRPCVIRLTGQALALESRGTLRRKIEQIPLDELVGLHSVLAQSDARALWLGCPGIEADELQWLRDALLRRIVASASPPQ